MFILESYLLPTHVGRVCPVLTSSGFFCPVTLFLPHDPNALLHSVTIFSSISPFLSSPSLPPSLSLHHANRPLLFCFYYCTESLSSNIQPSNLFQSSKPASSGSRLAPDILPGSLSTLQPRAFGRVSSARASGPSLNTQPQQLVPNSAQPSDSPEAIPQCPDILLKSQPPLHPATTLSLQQHAILAGASHRFPGHSTCPQFMMLPLSPPPESSEPLMPPATVCVSQTRDSSPFFTTQPPQLAMTSETTLDSLGFSRPSLPLSIIASSSTSSIFTLIFTS